MGRFEHLEMGDSHSEKPKEPEIQEETRDLDFYMNAAEKSFRREDYEKALSFFSRALEFDMNHAPAWLGQIRCLIGLDEIPEAIVWSDRALERFPNSGSLLAVRALAENRMGRSKDALGFSDAAFSMKGDTPFEWVSRGEILIPINITNSKACFLKAVEMDPKNSAVRCWIGQAFYFFWRYAEALEYFKEGARINAKDPISWYWMGRCEDKLGDITAAEGAYRRALAADPSFQAAREAYNSLEHLGLLSAIYHSFIHWLRNK